MTASILTWLEVNHYGDHGDFMRGLGLTLDEVDARILALEEEGLIVCLSYRWDGSPVYQLVKQESQPGAAGGGDE
jgi:hypothetical protein